MYKYNVLLYEDIFIFKYYPCSTINSTYEQYTIGLRYGRIVRHDIQRYF